MLKLDAKYEQLKLILAIEGFNMSEFEDHILGEYFQVDTKRNDITITIYQDLEKDALEVYIEKFTNNEWDRLEQRYYKTAKGALNLIKKF